MDELLESLLIYLDEAYAGRSFPTSASAKIQILTGLLKNRRILLAFDGIEVMQFNDHHRSKNGQFRSTDLQNFISLLADVGEYKSKVFITSRIPLTAFDQYSGYRSFDLEELNISEGIELLELPRVASSDRNLSELVEEHGGHALTLTLLAGFMETYAKVDASRITNIPKPLEDENRYEKLHEILRWYDELLKPKEQSFLMLFSAFRIPVNETALFRVFRKSNPLSEELAEMEEYDFIDLVNRIRNLRLIRYDEKQSQYTIHPLIRDFYRKKLETLSNTRDATYRKLCDDSLALPLDDDPNTLEKIAPVINAFYYACAARDYDLAYDIWHRNIQKERWAIQKQFGALEMEIELIEQFLPNRDRTHMPLVKERKRQAILINQLGYVLNRSALTTEAVRLLLCAGKLREDSEDWDNAACSFFDLAEAKTHLGDLQGATEASIESIDLARKGPKKRLYSAIASLAWVCFLKGDIKEALKQYDECQLLEDEVIRNPGSVYLADRVHRATFLMDTGCSGEADREVKNNIEFAKKHDWFDEIPSCIRQQGRLSNLNRNYEKAVELYTEALKQAKIVGRFDEILICLIHRADALIDSGKIVEAESDLSNAGIICKDSEWRLHEANVLLALAKMNIHKRYLQIARGQAEDALLLSKSLVFKWAKAHSSQLLGTIGKLKGNSLLAKDYYTEALGLYQELHSPKVVEVKREISKLM